MAMVSHQENRNRDWAIAPEYAGVMGMHSSEEKIGEHQSDGEHRQKPACQKQNAFDDPGDESRRRMFYCGIIRCFQRAVGTHELLSL